MENINKLFAGIFIAVFFLMTIVSAVPPQTQVSSIDTGLQIAYPKYDYVKQGESFYLHSHVFNKTSYVEDANCYIHLYDPYGSHLLKSQMENPPGEFDYEIYIDENNFSEVGIHGYILQCNTTIESGFVSGAFEITATGEPIDTAKAIFYIGLLFVLIILMGLSLWAHFQDKTLMWKIWWFCIVWVFAIAINFISWNMSADFLPYTTFISGFFRIIFLVLTVLFFPMVVVLILYSAYLLFWETEFRKLIEGRGLDEETAREMINRRRAK